VVLFDGPEAMDKKVKPEMQQKN